MHPLMLLQVQNITIPRGQPGAPFWDARGVAIAFVPRSDSSSKRGWAAGGSSAASTVRRALASTVA